MILGIDATNIRRGGGITHLLSLLRAATPGKYGFQSIIVWGGRSIIEILPERPWLKKVHIGALDGSLLSRICWQFTHFDKAFRQMNCDILLVPGGSYVGKVQPFVAISQNLLPFDIREVIRYRLSFVSVRLLFLRIIQGSTFRRADGCIFLTEYSQRQISSAVTVCDTHTVIPHGIDSIFFREPRRQMPLSFFSEKRPLRIVYVSIIDVYKHQTKVVKAMGILRRLGFPIKLELVGPAYPAELKRLQKTLQQEDPQHQYFSYIGPVSHEQLPQVFSISDLCLFASSCENLPILLLEAMATGLPIACSNKEPMPGILKDGGVYFDPENPLDISRVVRDFIERPESRSKAASSAYKEAKQYSWQRCSDDTLSFLRRVSGSTQQ